MLGRHHLFLSLFTATAIMLFFLNSNTQLIVFILIGVAIGSLMPDADSTDAAIFHSHVKISGGLGNVINAIIGPILPAFGWVTRWMIYKPALFVSDNTFLKKYHIQEHHRGFLHSFLGIGLATFMIGIYLGIILLIMHSLTWYFLFFLLAYLFGAFMHLVEDSCTVTGIQFNYPFSNQIVKGKLITRPELAKDPDRFTSVMGVFVVAIFFSMSYFNALPKALLPILAILLVVIAWAVFLKFVAKIEFVRGELQTYSNVKSLL